MLLSGLGTLFAEEMQQGRIYMKWNQQEAVALLTNSPWAVSRPVRSGSSNLNRGTSEAREGSGTCVETTMGTLETRADDAVAQAAGAASELSNDSRLYTVRFVSAQPVRMAIARWAILNGRITAEQAETMLKQDSYDGSIVVSLSASNDEDWAELNDFSTQSLKEENYLLLKKSKRKIFAERYIPPVESGIGEALFYFSRANDGKTLITPSEKEVSFNCRLSNRTQLRREFKLKDMIFNGELAI